MSQAVGEMHLPVVAHESRPSVSVVADDPLAALTARVSTHQGPEAMLELAALLEANGITDGVAVQRYEASDVFALAQRLLAARDRVANDIEAAPGTTVVPRRVLLRGPMTLTVLAVMLLELGRYQQGMADIGSPPWATLLGLSAGMLVAGATTQAMGWRVALSLSHGTVQAIRPALRLGIGGGLAASLLAALVLMLGGIAQNISLAGIVSMGVSCVGLNLILLLSACLSMLDRPELAGGALGLAFGGSWLLTALVPESDPLLVSIVPGVVTALTLMAALLVYVLRGRIPHSAEHIGPHLPAAGQLAYHALPYVCYGALGVVYVFVGQASGWVVALPALWTRAQVIATLSSVHMLGLIAMVLSQGVAEYILRSFWTVVSAAQKRVHVGDRHGSSQAIHQFLRRAAWTMIGVQSVVASFIAGLAYILWPMLDLTPLIGPLVPAVFLEALVAYILLGWGLFCCSLLVTLAYPRSAASAMGVATIGHAIGVVLFGLSGSLVLVMFGTLLGGAVLVVITQWIIARLLRRGDYMLYRAF